jgi:hypothetical protein
MVKISISVEDLQNITDIVLKYSEMSLKKRSVIGVHLADRSISLQNEIVQLKFIGVFDVMENLTNSPGFSFDVKAVPKKFPGDRVEIDFLKNVVYVKSGKLKADIRSDFSHESIIERKLEVCDSLTIRNSDLLKAIQKVKMPYAFYRGDANRAPICIKSVGENTIEISASDGYSLCRFTTAGQATPEFNIVIPRVTMSSFLNKHLEKEGVTTIEIQEMAVKIKSGSMYLVSSQLTDVVDDFQATLDANKAWSFGGVMAKRELSSAIKTISGSVNDKKSVNYVNVKVKPSDKTLDLGYSSSKIGGMSYTDIGFESLEFYDQTAQFVVNLHMKAFEEFTALLEDKFHWYGNKRAVYYREQNESGVVEYIYPTVNI